MDMFQKNFRSMPGPSIVVCKHDTVILDLVNELATEATSIHFHGK